jgi:hypothetical protein
MSSAQDSARFGTGSEAKINVVFVLWYCKMSIDERMRSDDNEINCNKRTTPQSTHWITGASSGIPEGQAEFR